MNNPRISKRRYANYLWKPHIFLENGIWKINPANEQNSIHKKAITRMRGYNHLAFNFTFILNHPNIWV